MRADKRSDGEIIADIINLVDYPPVRVLVERRIDDLRRMLPPFTGNQKENREYAKGLREQIIELQRTLENRQSFLLKARFWQLWYEQGTAFEINPQTRDYIAQEPAPLTKELSWLRALCDEIIKFEPESTATQSTNRTPTECCCHCQLRSPGSSRPPCREKIPIAFLAYRQVHQNR